MEAEAGGGVSILVRDGKRTGAYKKFDVKDAEQPHVLLEGEVLSVEKAMSLIDDLWNFQIVRRKIVIPAGVNSARHALGCMTRPHKLH